MRNRAILVTLTLVLTACASPATPPFIATNIPTNIPTIAATSTITPTPTVGPGGFPRRFRVQDNAFVDQFGQKMIFRGMVSPDPTLMSVCTPPNVCGDPNMPPFNEAYYKAFASWGANIIRVPIVPYSLHAKGMDAVLKALDQTITWAGENKMYVIIDFHSIGWLPDNWFAPGSGDDTTTVEEWTNFWQTISSRYANNDVVTFYELFNEPALPWDRHNFPYTKADWSAWKGLVENLLTNTIRPNDPNKIVLVGGLLSSYDLSHVAAAPIIDKFNNVAYATHPYPDGLENQHLSWDAGFGNLSKKYPVLVTEYSYDNSPGKDPPINGVPYHQAIIEYLEAHQIGWLAWNFSTTWPSCLLKDNRTFEPSESGAYFRSRLLELNFPGVPTLPPSTPLPTSTR